MRLSELKTGESATILKVLGHGGFRRRIMEMGFVRGQRVEVLLNAPLKDPIEYRIMGYDISLRRSEADMIQVLSDAEAREYLAQRHSTRPRRCGENPGSAESSPAAECAAEVPDEACCRTLDEVVRHRSRTISVALVGNPNSGKTSLFNAISGGHEHVGNYSGVTVGAKCGSRVYRGYRFEVTDLPGTYALSAYTPEERFVRRHIARETPDVIINSVVASNLERNLYLTTELIDINPRMVVALNMFDELKESGAHLDYENLGRMLGVPMVPVEARNNRGIDALLDTVIAVYENQDARVRHIHIRLGGVIEEGLQRLKESMSIRPEALPKAFPPRYYAMKMLEKDGQVEEVLQACEDYPVWAEIRDREARSIAEALGEDVETAFANQKYGFISGALKETFTPGKHAEATATTLIDTFVTHKLWGFPIFFFLMWFMFWCTFSLGSYPQAWIDVLVGWIGDGVDALLPPGPLRDLLSDGVIGGVGAVIVFLPNIMILYLFISFMEDSGYLARAAFIMDRVMHRIGLHGKSFIPLIMGFGCNVPAIMASRTIESRSSRLITILITPFMSCSARLPIYILLAGTFFSAHAGLVMTGLYLLGLLAAVATARLMRRALFPVDETPFVMELPPYRLPTWKTTLAHMWDKCAQYLRKMGGMILIASVIVWFLSYYPRTEQTAHVSAHYANSYLGRLGRVSEPVFSPLGLDWKAGVALLTGVAAKEIVVSTLGVLYSEAEVPAQAAVDGTDAAPGDSTDSGSRVDSANAAGRTAFDSPVNKKGGFASVREDSRASAIGESAFERGVDAADDAVNGSASDKPANADSRSDVRQEIPDSYPAPAREERFAGDGLSASGTLPATAPAEAVHKAAAKPERGAALSERLLSSGDFTTASALAFLVFILLYFPCIATVAAIGAEAGWKWAAAAVVYDTLLAWLAAWGVYHLVQLL